MSRMEAKRTRTRRRHGPLRAGDRVIPGTIVLLVLLACPAAHAQVYRWVDSEGVVHLSSEKPPAGVKAEHKHGVVTITLQKAEAVRPRRIEVKAS